MVRWGMLCAGAAVIAGAAFVTGASIPPRPSVAPPRPDEAKAVVIGQKTGYFNMAQVMREYARAVDQVKDLNAERTELTAEIQAWRARYLKAKEEVDAPGTSREDKEKLGREMVQLARQIEDKDRDVNKLLNDRATQIISALYDDIRAVTVEVARENGLLAVLTFPDAATAEERDSPQVKELKLKPPAASPFYLDPSVDYTGELIRRLNAKYAARPKK